MQADTRPGPPHRVATLMHNQVDPVKSMFGTVPLHKRAAALIDSWELGLLIDLVSAALSLLTVITYMVETSYTADDPVYWQLKVVDLVCSMVFAAEWGFWFWLAHDRLRYIFSTQSLVDVVTVIPMFVSFFINSKVLCAFGCVSVALKFQGFAFFEQLVRILRVLRVFRIFRLGKRLSNEVHARLLTLLFTLLALIFVTAGLFYELETTYGERYPDLTIQQAIYWSVVTTTTIGYGDFSPSIVASQLNLIVMLLIAFTVLPCQTSALANAYSYTSTYQTARYNQTARGRHVVITGHLQAARIRQMVEELYHDDHGFHDFNIVLMGPEAPSDEMRRLLKVHKHAHRLLYIQGSCLNHTDLNRAQVEVCDVLFIMCSSQTDDAAQEDLRNSTACLVVGQYLQMQAHARKRQGPKPFSEQLAQVVKAVLMKLQPRKHYTGTPRVYVQLVLPESQQNLRSLVERYAFPAQTPRTVKKDLAPGAVPTADNATVMVDCMAESAGNFTSTNKRECCSGTSSITGSSFWQDFAQNIIPLCVTELRFSLLGYSCLGCPGAITLVSNLLRSVDAQGLLQAEFQQLSKGVQEYIDGSANELYELGPFPHHLVGKHVWLVAAYLQQHYRACLIATSGSTQPHTAASAGDRANQEQVLQQHAAGDVSSNSTGAQAAGYASAGSGIAADHQIRLAPLRHIITAKTTGYVIASDLRVVYDIMAEPAEEFLQWYEQQRASGKLDQASEVLAGGTLTTHASSDKAFAALQRWQLAAAAAAAAAAATGGCIETGARSAGHVRRHTADAVLLGVSAIRCPAGSASSTPAAAAAAVTMAGPALKQSAGLETLTEGLSSSGSGQGHHSDATQQQETDCCGHCPQQSCEGNHSIPHHSSNSQLAENRADPSTATHSPALKLDGSSPPSGHDGNSWVTAGSRDTARLRRLSARSLISLVPGPLSGLPALLGVPAVEAAGNSSSRRRHRGAIMLNTSPTRTSSGILHVSDVALAVQDAQAGRRLWHTLSSASSSRRRRSLIDMQLQALYHTRVAPQQGNIMQELLHTEVHCEGHILVFSNTTPPTALFSLLAPLRSARLAAAAVPPVVVVGSVPPHGLEWEAIARLDNVFYMQGEMNEADTLLCANAEAAGTAVLLLPWGSDGRDAVDPVLQDACVMAAARHLTALNANMQVYCELNQQQSLLYLDPLGSFLDLRCGEATAAAATPAFMSGSIILPRVADSMLCQALYCQSSPALLSKLLTQWHSCALLGTADTSNVPPSDMHHKPAAAAAAAEHEADCVAASIRHQVIGVGMAMLQQVPTCCYKCDTFGDLFWLLLCENGMLCIALYRQQVVHDGRSVWYVLTNPEHSTVLCETDRAFVLG